MAFCLILVGQFNQRDGLLTIGFGLLAHALAYVGYTFYGHAPLWFTYGAANSLLADDVSNLKQTISVSIGTFTAMMISLGLVLLAKERSESSLKHMALRDVLTGILNRRAILERFASELERARRDRSCLAVAMVDIDHFKQINDRHGHLAGDEVISHCARHLSQRLRASDSIGRYGGEEFLLLLPCTDPEAAETVLDELRLSLASAPAQYGGSSIALRISIGVCCDVPDERDTTASLLAKADAALYEAKGLGRDRLRFAAAVESQ